MRSLLLAGSFLVASLVGAPAFAQSNAAATQNATQQAVPHEGVQVVDAFMRALADGQLDTARQYMTPDAVVMSNGQVLGNRDGYIDGPAKADAAALRGTQRELLNRGASMGADIGWVISEKRVRGQAPGAQGQRELHVTETMSLAKTPGGWKITHIHWSGRTAG